MLCVIRIFHVSPIGIQTVCRSIRPSERNSTRYSAAIKLTSHITCSFKQVCVHFTQAASVYTANELYSNTLPGPTAIAPGSFDVCL